MNELLKFIKIVKAPLANATVAELLKYLDSQKEFRPATTIGDGDNNSSNKGGQIRKVSEHGFRKYHQSMTHVHWHNLLCHTIMGEAENYRVQQKEMSAMKMTHLSALKYEKSDHYVFHVDHCVDIPRTLSVIYLLNNDYKG